MGGRERERPAAHAAGRLRGNKSRASSVVRRRCCSRACNYARLLFTSVSASASNYDDDDDGDGLRDDRLRPRAVDELSRRDDDDDNDDDDDGDDDGEREGLCEENMEGASNRCTYDGRRRSRSFKSLIEGLYSIILMYIIYLNISCLL